MVIFQGVALFSGGVQNMTTYYPLEHVPHPGCNRHLFLDYEPFFRLGNPNLNLHLWLAPWVGGTRGRVSLGATGSKYTLGTGRSGYCISGCFHSTGKAPVTTCFAHYFMIPKFLTQWCFRCLNFESVTFWLIFEQNCTNIGGGFNSL